jgi:hypothetical protein
VKDKTTEEDNEEKENFPKEGKQIETTEAFSWRRTWLELSDFVTDASLVESVANARDTLYAQGQSVRRGPSSRATTGDAR